MNDNQVLGVLFSIAVVTILLIGAGLGLFVNWLLRSEEHTSELQSH